MVLGDRLALMSEGAIRQVGTPEEVYEHPADEFCATFMGTVNRLPSPSETPGGSRGTRGPAEVAFRPEDVEIGADGPYLGRVEGTEFLGFYRQYRIAVPTGGGGEAVVIARTDRRTSLQVGEQVRFGVRATLGIGGSGTAAVAAVPER